MIMASSYLIRLGKVKGENGVLVALKHNKRILQAEHGTGANIDVTKTSLNYSLVNDHTPEQIARDARLQMFIAGIEKPRRDCVRAVEVVISLPVDRHKQDTRPFFIDSFEWVKQTFAGELLAFDIHLDESAPHAHAILLPLVDGKMQGNKMVGNTGNLKRLINKFHNEVAKHYGLSRSDRKRLTYKDKQCTEKLVLKRLHNDPVMKSCIWPCVRDSIHIDPLPYAQILNIQLAEKPIKHKSFVSIMTSKGKGNHTNTT